MTVLVCFALIALSILLALIFFQKKFRYFKNRGIDGPMPSFFGNTKEAFFKRKHLTYEVGDIYKYEQSK